MCELTLLGCLGICAIEDIRWRKVRLLNLLIFGVLGVVLKCVSKSFEPMDMFFGFLVGVFVLIVSVLSREQIGKGDAVLLMVSGIYLGFWGNAILLFVSSTLAGIKGLFMMIRNRKNLKKKMAFVPYLTFSYAIMMAISIYEKGYL